MGFMFHDSYYEAAQTLPQEQQGEFYKMLVDYACGGVEPECEGVMRLGFDLVRPVIDKSVMRSRAGAIGGSATSEAKRTASRANGSKGGRPQEPKQNPSKTQAKTQAKPKQKPKLEERRGEERKGVEKKGRATLDEVKAYVEEKGYTFDPEAFVAYYESNGWRVGKNPMRDWHAACRTWQSRESKKEVPDEFKVYDGSGVRVLWDASQA